MGKVWCELKVGHYDINLKFYDYTCSNHIVHSVRLGLLMNLGWRVRHNQKVFHGNLLSVSACGIEHTNINMHHVYVVPDRCVMYPSGALNLIYSQIHEPSSL